MIVETKMFKEACSKVLQAVARSELTPITETLELKTVKEGPNNLLLLNVTNREYFVSIKFFMDHEEDFHATVNASTFLKLVAQMTSDKLELKCTEKYVSIKGNGSYRVPLIFDGEELLDLPPIIIENVLSSFDISTEILRSIIKYNSRRLAKKTFAQDIQTTYYVDQQGCITFASGACVNNFELAQPVKFLLSDAVVRLFKLFDSDEVHFCMGVDPLTDSLMQTKVSFFTDQITLTALAPVINIESMPTAAVRQAANTAYAQTIVLNREALQQALSRLLVISSGAKFAYGIFTLTADELIIEDLQKNNSEVLKYQNGSFVRDSYSFVQELNTLKQLVSDWSEGYLTLCCGNSHMIAIKRGKVVDVLPEVKMSVD